MLKATGVVRRVDDLGRIVIPMELRRTMSIGEGDSLEIFVDEEKIVLRKYNPGCIFCGNAEDVMKHRDKCVCRDCQTELRGGLPC